MNIAYIHVYSIFTSCIQPQRGGAVSPRAITRCSLIIVCLSINDLIFTAQFITLCDKFGTGGVKEMHIKKNVDDLHVIFFVAFLGGYERLQDGEYERQ